jgi:thiol-disulfide isomerase/thioredoxin
MKTLWNRLRSRFWLSLAFDAAVLALVLFSVHAWQTRDLPANEPAPATVLPLLGSAEQQAAITPGAVGIVYFFAPWCRVCRVSIGNLDSLVKNGQLAWGTVVALDYADADEVQSFIDRAEVSLPVLLGNPRTAAEWSVRVFPTYYVIDAAGRIHSRSVGYSTWAGMWVRSWFADGAEGDPPTPVG